MLGVVGSLVALWGIQGSSVPALPDRVKASARPTLSKLPPLPAGLVTPEDKIMKRARSSSASLKSLPTRDTSPGSEFLPTPTSRLSRKTSLSPLADTTGSDSSKAANSTASASAAPSKKKTAAKAKGQKAKSVKKSGKGKSKSKGKVAKKPQASSKDQQQPEQGKSSRVSQLLGQNLFRGLPAFAAVLTADERKELLSLREDAASGDGETAVQESSGAAALPDSSKAATPDSSKAAPLDSSKAAPPDSPKAAPPDSPKAAPLESLDSSEAAPPDSSKAAHRKAEAAATASALPAKGEAVTAAKAEPTNVLPKALPTLIKLQVSSPERLRQTVLDNLTRCSTADLESFATLLGYEVAAKAEEETRPSTTADVAMAEDAAAATSQAPTISKHETSAPAFHPTETPLQQPAKETQDDQLAELEKQEKEAKRKQAHARFMKFSRSMFRALPRYM